MTGYISIDPTKPLVLFGRYARVFNQKITDLKLPQHFKAATNFFYVIINVVDENNKVWQVRIPTELFNPPILNSNRKPMYFTFPKEFPIDFFTGYSFGDFINFSMLNRDVQLKIVRHEKDTSTESLPVLLERFKRDHILNTTYKEGVLHAAGWPL